MLHEQDMSLARFGKIVCTRTRVATPEVLTTGDPNPHNIDYVGSLQYTQRQGHDLTNISNRTAPGN